MVSLADPTTDRAIAALDPRQLLAPGRDESMYHRARSYYPETGRFNRLDPFAGLAEQPLSYHKYNYTLANPIMGADPSGLADINIISLVKTVAVQTLIGAAIGGVGGYAIGKVTGVGGLRGAFLGAIAGASIGFSVAKGDWGSVVKAAITDGIANLAVEFFVQLADDDQYLLTKEDAVGSFMEGFAYGAAGAAFSLELNRRFDWADKWDAIGGASLAAVTSVIVDITDSLASGEGLPDFWPTVGNAAKAAVLSIASNPLVLGNIASGRRGDKAIEGAEEALRNADLLSAMFANAFAVPSSVFVTNAYKTYQGELP